MAAKKLKAGEIRRLRKELAFLEDESSRLLDQMIAEGRGTEKPSEYLRKKDPLAAALKTNYERREALRARFNPGGKRFGGFKVRRGWSLRLAYPLSFSRRRLKRLNSCSRKRKKLFSGMGTYLPSRRILKEIMADPERRKKLFSDAAKAISAVDEPGTRPRPALKRKRGRNMRPRKRKGNRKRGRNVGRRPVYKFEKRRMFRLA
jgi:hypothetical protein